MDSYRCEDCEELFWGYKIVAPDLKCNLYTSLVGIVDSYELAKAGRPADVLEYIRRHNFTKDAMGGACEGGHKELVHLLIQMGVKDWDSGLLGACSSGQKELARLMIQKGASAFDEGLDEAYAGNQKEIVLMMINYGAIPDRDDMYRYCGGDNPEMALFIIQNINSRDSGLWSAGLNGTCDSGYKDVALALIKKMEYCNNIGSLKESLQDGFLRAYMAGHKELVSLLFQYLMKWI
jgi:hypothetical protein